MFFAIMEQQKRTRLYFLTPLKAKQTPKHSAVELKELLLVKEKTKGLSVSIKNYSEENTA